MNYIHAAKNPDKVWRYQPKDGTNDSSVTTWMAITLQSARDFGLPIAKKDLEDVLAWFDEVTDPASGRVGYKRKGEASFREKRSVLRFPPSKTEALTAMGLFSRILLGQTPKTNPVLNLSAQRLLEKPPVWNEADGSIDMYYWYFGTYAMFQMGKKYWKGWRKGLESALLKHQRKDGHSKGSWDPVGVWGEEGGRIYSTALSVLCLEVYYRYRALLR